MSLAARFATRFAGPIAAGLGALGVASCELDSSGPCNNYCDYICECHADDGSLSCEDCRTIYSDEDPSLQDECETSLTDLQNADADAGTGCPLDTGAAER